MQSQVQALAKYGQIDAARKSTETMVTSAYAGRTLVSEILDKLSLVVPDNVWFATHGSDHPRSGRSTWRYGER